MANSWGVIDVYPIVTAAYQQATGRTDLVAIDTTSFVAIGSKLTETQQMKETTLGVLSQMTVRTIFNDRVSRRRFDLLRATEERWGGVVRKVTFLPLDPEESESFNTDLNPDQLADGNSVDMYKIRKPKVIELNFWGQKILKTHITRFMYQLDAAVRNEEEMARFLRSMMLSFYNDITRINDAKTRLVVLNAIAGAYAMGNAVDLVAGYNTEHGTTLTRDQLLTTYQEDFLKYMVSEINIDSDNMEDPSSLYHANLTGMDAIVRETPKSEQRMLFYKPFFTKAKANVFSTIFNPDELRLGEYSTVNFWQDKKSPTEVKIKPTYLDVDTGESKDAEETVIFDYVLGIMYDVEFMGVFPKFEYATTTPLNSNGLYWNEFVHWSFNNWTDFTENHRVYYLGAGGQQQAGD